MYFGVQPTAAICLRSEIACGVTESTRRMSAPESLAFWMAAVKSVLSVGNSSFTTTS